MYIFFIHNIKLLFLTIGVLILGFTCVAYGGETFSLRNIQTGEKIPSFSGTTVTDNSRINFTPVVGKPSVVIFFTMEPPFRQKRSVDLIMQMDELIQEQYADKVDVISIFSDDKEIKTLKDFIRDGLIPKPVVNDSANKIYNDYGVFMTPIVILGSTKGTLHAVIPATYNIKQIVQNNLKFLLGEWSEEEFQKSFQPTFNKKWTPEEKEYLRRVNYGKIMYSRKMYSPALREFATAAKIQPESPEAHIGLGTVHYDMKKYVKAEKAFNKALSLDADSDEAISGLGLTLFKTGRIEQAKPILENALISETPKLEVIINLAEIYENEGDIKKAVRLNKMAIMRLQSNIDN